MKCRRAIRRSQPRRERGALTGKGEWIAGLLRGSGWPNRREAYLRTSPWPCPKVVHCNAADQASSLRPGLWSIADREHISADYFAQPSGGRRASIALACLVDAGLASPVPAAAFPQLESTGDL